MKLSNKTYNFLKWFLFIFAPALISLMGGLAELYQIDLQLYMTLISILVTFIGAITGISNQNYHKEKEEENE